MIYTYWMKELLVVHALSKTIGLERRMILIMMGPQGKNRHQPSADNLLEHSVGNLVMHQSSCPYEPINMYNIRH